MKNRANISDQTQETLIKRGSLCGEDKKWAFWDVLNCQKYNDFYKGKGSEKREKKRIFYGLLPNRGGGGSAREVKKP